MNTNNTPTGWTAMRLWNKKWKAHRIPKFMKVALRALLKARHTRGTTSSIEDLLFSTGTGIIDHWGTAIIGEEEVFITQPYARGDKEHKAFAELLGVSVEYCGSGPWNSATSLYVYRSKHSESSKL